MSEWKRRPGTTYLGTVPVGTVMTEELMRQLYETRPRQEFDIEIKPNDLPALPKPN